MRNVVLGLRLCVCCCARHVSGLVRLSFCQTILWELWLNQLNMPCLPKSPDLYQTAKPVTSRLNLQKMLRVQLWVFAQVSVNSVTCVTNSERAVDSAPDRPTQ